MAATTRVIRSTPLSHCLRIWNVSCFDHTTRQTAALPYYFDRRCKYTKTKAKEPEDKVLPPFKVQRYFYNRLVNFVTMSFDKLEKRMPKTYKAYHTFKTGISMFLADTKQFYGVTTRLWGGESLSHFTRRELELYRQFSSDLPVMGIVLILAFAPGGVLVFPLAYMFPRYLLSPHFWTEQQRETFGQMEMKKRLKHYPSILDNMYRNADHCNRQELVKKVVNKVRSGKQLDTSVVLSPKDIIHLKPLFEHKPYSVDSLPLGYRWHLSKSLGLSIRKRKLVKGALLLRFIDEALQREGIHNLTDDDLDKACAWRGLNPKGMDRDAQLSYLKSWTDITTLVREPSISLLLHLPVLLGYRQPSNRKLMGSRHNATSRHK